MSLIDDFADWFKSRRTTVEAWYEDGKGKYAFRVTVDGQVFVCAARSSAANGRTSIFQKVCGKAQVQNALIALRIGDAIHVFDPVTVLDQGAAGEAKENERKKRGEEWVYFDVGLGCRFDDWIDGNDTPVRYGDLDDF